jgi:hypothetical protein
MPNQVMYGFYQLQDVFNQRVNQVGADVVSRAIDATVAEHNRQINALLDLFCQRTTEHTIRYKTPTAARLMGLDENGRARPVKSQGFYDIAFPLQSAGIAWGANYKSRVKMTVQEANDATATLISADIRWIRDHILAAIFANMPWVFTDEQFGNLQIKGPANADTDLYLIMQGQDQPAIDNHFFAQAALIADATNPFPNIYTELTEHPENQGEVVVFVSSVDRPDVEGLANFFPLPDLNVRLGVGQAQLVGSLSAAIPGRLLGYVDQCWVAEWPVLPNHYAIGVTVAGEPPLAMREEPEPELQGFNRVADRDDYPWYERQYLRTAGFGAWNRVGVVVQQVGAGVYGVPAGYESPMD